MRLPVRVSNFLLLATTSTTTLPLNPPSSSSSSFFFPLPPHPTLPYPVIGDFNLWEKIWGGTSNNADRAAARAGFRQITTIDQYDPKKAKESKEWLAKYGYKRYYLPYLDKSAEGQVEPAAAPKAAAPAPKVSSNHGSSSGGGGGGGGSMTNHSSS